MFLQYVTDSEVKVSFLLESATNRHSTLTRWKIVFTIEIWTGFEDWSFPFVEHFRTKWTMHFESGNFKYFRTSKICYVILFAQNYDSFNIWQCLNM